MYTLVLTAITILLIALSNTANTQKSSKTNNITSVIVAPVVKSEFADHIEALATTKSNESVIITADRSEKIASIHFDDGQQVKKNDLLVTLDKNQEEAELRAIQALTAERQSSYDRAKGLSGSNALPKATLDTRLAELKQSQAQTQAIRARLESYKITAPFDGVLGLREVSIGALVQPGDTITTIDDLSQIKVDFDVPSVFLTALRPGLPITGYIEAFGNRAFSGVIKTINTQIDPITRTVKVRAILPNNNNLLRPGLLMSIQLSKNIRQSLLIPEEALIKKSENNFVFLVVTKDNKSFVKQVAVKIGSRQPGIIEILSGLQEGDKIVNHGLTKIRDGNEITIRAEEKNNETLQELIKQSSLTQHLTKQKNNGVYI